MNHLLFLSLKPLLVFFFNVGILSTFHKIIKKARSDSQEKFSTTIMHRKILQKIEKYSSPESKKFQGTALIIDRVLRIEKQYENSTILTSKYLKQ